MDAQSQNQGGGPDTAQHDPSRETPEQQAKTTTVMPAQEPTVGRIVHVAMDPKRNNGSDFAPAIITRVWSRTCVNVTIFPDAADPFMKTSRTMREPGQTTEHEWFWPSITR